MNVYAKDGEKTILIQDGKIIKITQTQSIETNGTKQTQNKKVELGENNQFTKEIKEQKTEEVKNFVEKGVLPPDGKLSLSLKGSKVEQNLSTAASQGV